MDPVSYFSKNVYISNFSKKQIKAEPDYKNSILKEQLDLEQRMELESDLIGKQSLIGKYQKLSGLPLIFDKMANHKKLL